MYYQTCIIRELLFLLSVTVVGGGGGGHGGRFSISSAYAPFVDFLPTLLSSSCLKLDYCIALHCGGGGGGGGNGGDSDRVWGGESEGDETE